MTRFSLRFALVAIPLAGLISCGPAPVEEPVVEQPRPVEKYALDLGDRLAKLPGTEIGVAPALLEASEPEVIRKLVEASAYIDQIFLRQVSERNPEWLALLEKDAADGIANAADALALFRVYAGPWDRLDENRPFVEGVGDKPAGAGFYPPDMTADELNAWIESHPEDREAFQGLFSVIRRSEDGGLRAIPYSEHYREYLEPAAQLLREAAGLTKNASLRDYLNKRADAFLSDDYYESDVAWMDLDSEIEIVIGPYEVYEDELFNYKASFESFVTLVDRVESERLSVYASRLPAMERNLPIPDEHKNPNRGTESPIKVVQEIFTAGDTKAGVQTAAFNLPNDERVREAKGSKKVLLKNVIEAKYRRTGELIAQRVLDPALVEQLSFDAFFNQILFHELSHGLGPGIITGPDGNKVEARLLLRDSYSTIEECKADVLGLWNILYALDRGFMDGITREQLFTTYAGVMFRSMRFGLDAAHGGGMAIQWNWFREKGAIVPGSEQFTFAVDHAKFEEAIRSLANELLMIEATGDYERAQKLLTDYRKETDEITQVIQRLQAIPVDLRPVYASAK